MANQTGRNMYVAFKVEAAFNTVPDPVTGAEKMRINPSPGLKLARPSIQPGEVRGDMLTPMGRLGSRAVSGSYSGDLYVNAWDTLLAAVLRSTWVAAVAITEAAMTSITTTTNTIVAAGGSWLTQGVRTGDLVRLTGHSTAANNDKNLRVVSVTTDTITVPAGELTLDAGADSAFTLTILKKLMNGATPVRNTYYIEQCYQDIDQSQVFGGCRCVGFTLRGQPDGMATVEFRFLGASMTDVATGSSPVYTSPTLNTNTGLVFTDAKLSLDGTDIVIATAFELNVNLGGATLPVIGSNYTPDVFDDELVLSGSLSVLRQDLDYVAAFDAETEFELAILLQEVSGTPQKAFGLYVPRVKFTDADAPLGNDGAMVESLPWMSGINPLATGYDQTMLTICTDTAA